MLKNKSLNYKILLFFAPVLILIGLAGFLVPPDIALTSGAVPYNLLHLFFGFVGFLILFSKNENSARAFNIGFGAIDLLQAAASFAHVFPMQYFRWTRTDDILHIVIGAFLVAAGLYGYKNPTA